MLGQRVLLCAETVLLDKESGLVSAINVLEGAALDPNFPIMLPPFSILSITERSGDAKQRWNVTVTLELEHEGGSTELATIEGVADFQSAPVNRMIFKVAGVVLEHPGVLHVRVAYENSLASDYTIRFSTRQDRDGDRDP